MWKWLFGTKKGERAPGRCEPKVPATIVRLGGPRQPPPMPAGLAFGDLDAALREDLAAIPEIRAADQAWIYGVARIAAPQGGQHQVFVAVMALDGMTKKRATEITQRIGTRAVMRSKHKRMLSSGITHARWMASGAPCGNPRMTTSHERLDGKSFAIEKGMRVGKRYIWPGMEGGCRCTSIAVIDGFDD